MKYIRTKDGNIIDTTKSIANTSFFKPIKESDTIEELCDGYIVELPMRNFRFYYEQTRHCYAFRNAVDEYNSWKKSNSNMSIEGEGAKELVYLWGVIWVKGANWQPVLKFVAKLNEEGELQLL